MATAAILGLDTAAGAYLTRLLDARGHRIRGTGSTALVDQLGVGSSVATFDDAAEAILGAGEIYDLRGDAALVPALLATAPATRLFVAVDPADGTTIAALAAARGTGAFVATGRVHPHESRLGPGTTPLARIVAATAAGNDPAAADLASTTDCGWTAEYVDAMARMLQQLRALDCAIATGRVISGSDAARVAAKWFARPAPAAVAASTATPGDPAPAYAALGWRATTWGDDLIEVLCEAIAARRA